MPVRLILALAFALVLFAPSRVAAQTTPRGPFVGAVLEGVLEYGGDRVAEFLFTDGDTQTMRAGQGGTVAVGLEVRPAATSRFGVRGTVGFKYVTTAASNANITLTRVPLELVGTVDIARGIWAGGGVVHHARIRFAGDDFLPDVSFDGRTGATLEAGWRFVALTYTFLEYEDEFGNTYDASSPGVSLRYVFPLTGR